MIRVPVKKKEKKRRERRIVKITLIIYTLNDLLQFCNKAIDGI